MAKTGLGQIITPRPTPKHSTIIIIIVIIIVIITTWLLKFHVFKRLDIQRNTLWPCPGAIRHTVVLLGCAVTSMAIICGFVDIHFCSHKISRNATNLKAAQQRKKQIDVDLPRCWRMFSWQSLAVFLESKARSFMVYRLLSQLFLTFQSCLILTFDQGVFFFYPGLFIDGYRQLQTWLGAVFDSGPAMNQG